MAINAEEVRTKTFPIIRKGYEQGAVHRYLDAVASELESFNRQAAADDEIVVADVIDEPQDSQPASVSAPTTNVEEPAALSNAPQIDDFDRVGNEISLMLRQAQESAIKIRNDAEVEARTLVDQVRLDIEADRLAHEQAAGELIARTEERAAEVRAEAESYSKQTRAGADDYATERKNTVEREAAEITASSEADRKLAEDKLSAATEEANAMTSEARKRSEEIIENAEADAQARSDQLLGEARQTLTTLIEAEESSRDNLQQARSSIQAALDQLKLTEIDSTAITGSA